MSKFTNAIKGMSKLKKASIGLWLSVAASLIALVAILIAFGSHVGDKKNVAGKKPFNISQTVDGDKASAALETDVITVIQDPNNTDVLSAVITKLGKDKIVSDEAEAIKRFNGTAADNTATPKIAAVAAVSGPLYSIDRAGSKVIRYMPDNKDAAGKYTTTTKSEFVLTANDEAKVFTQDAKNKSNATAAVGTVFALVLVGAIGVTVAESIYKKRGAK